ncbi:MAG: hypothetical protein HQ523_11570 [Lentisphaerae bacterium]|nr:hypothetical protein [Lentisphaerota bacterium]
MGTKNVVNSNYLKWFHEIEKALWSFFGLFGELCGQCAQDTLEAMAAGEREGRDAWCCCMIDNQVHDNWESLNAVQSRINRQWYDAIRREKRVRGVGNGPCPALGEQGCRIKKCRPITCTTQLCSKMLVVLNDLGVVQSATHRALQIEDLIALPDILPDLYGTRKGRTVSRADVDAYLAALQRMKERFTEAVKGGNPTPH